MTTKDFLQMGYFLELRMKFKEERIEKLRALAERTTTNLSGLPKGSGTHDARERAIASLADEEMSVYEDLAELAQIRTDIDASIKAVSEPRLQMLLELRYLMYKTWEEIAESLCYDVRHVHRLHAEALKAVIVPEKYQCEKPAS